MQKFLVIQTAFIGDVVLATGIIEKLHAYFPEARIDFLVRKGNESLLAGHPYLHEVLVWNKKEHKLRNLWRMLRIIRGAKYDKVINVQRFAATGLLTAFSGAHETIGFDKNPLSSFFSKSIPHVISYDPDRPDPINAPAHEIDRNQLLIRAFTDPVPAKPRLYPSQQDYEKVREYVGRPYITVSPASVWFTKQYPADKWSGFLKKLPEKYTVYFLGAPSDRTLCDGIIADAGITTGPAAEPEASNPRPGTRSLTPQTTRFVNLCGTLSFLQSAALMKDAVMNYVNDSAPMHFASSVNAPVTAVYCSTIPAFGFGPLSDEKFIVELLPSLDCRPCGLHGYKACPLGHFHCAYWIADEQLLATLPG